MRLRRGRESNPRIAVLQTATLPLGYPAAFQQAELSSARADCQRGCIRTTPPIYGFAICSFNDYRCVVTKRSSNLFARARARIPGGVNSPVRAFRAVGGEPFFVDRAQGSHVWTIDGVALVDYVGSSGPTILGHAPAVLSDALRAAALNGASFGIPNTLEVEMAELICAWMPSIEKVRMVNSGTEATMSCLRLARGFTGRNKIIKFEGCYHGHVDSLLVNAGSGALTHGRPDSAGVPAEFAALTISVPFNHIDAVRRAFRENPKAIAAIILEPIPANAGLYFPRENFLQQLRDECDREGTLLIFDEVMTGFRVARGGAQEIYGIRPD